MDQTGNIILANTQRIGETGGAVLQQNQQVVARVLRVSNDSVILSLQGMRFEARLTSPEQADMLRNAVFAQFRVRDLTAQNIQLQLIRTDQNILPSSNQSLPLNMDGLAQTLLKNLGLPVDELNLTLAKAILERGMSLDGKMLSELRQILTKVGTWNEQDIQNLLLLKEMGLPVSDSILGLMANGKPELTSMMLMLRSQLNHLLNQKPGLDSNLTGVLKNALSQLDGFLIRWDKPSKNLQENLQQIFQQVGNSLERQLGNIIREGNSTLDVSNLQNLLMMLKTLQDGLNQAGISDTSKMIEQFIQQYKGVQYMNTFPETGKGGEGWINLDLPLVTQTKQDMQETETPTAKIRIGYHKEKASGGNGNPDFTRLILQVDLKDGELIETDLSIAGQKIGIRVNTTSDPVREIAQNEFDSLVSALSDIGYEVASKRFGTVKRRAMNTTSSGAPGEKTGGWVIAPEKYDVEA